MSATADVYRRTDGKWAFRIVAGNGEIVAVDGGQGYENRSDAERTARRLANGWEADMKKHTDTFYGVARNETILHDRLYPTYAEASARLTGAEAAMTDAGLEPDLRIVEVDATTSYSRPRAAKAPENGGAENGTPETGSQGEGVVFGPTGVWGDTDGVLERVDPNPESIGQGQEIQATSTADTTDSEAPASTDAAVDGVATAEVIENTETPNTES